MVRFEEIEDVLRAQPGLKYYEALHDLKGYIHINQIESGEHMVGDFPVRIYLPADYPNEVPSVFAPGFSIPKGYAHVFISNGRLCLGTVADQYFFLAERHSLKEWLDSYVIPYFFSVEYFRKYEISPFGERSHGFKGTLEYYQELFEVKDLERAYRFLEFLATQSYRGSLPCPCDSGKRIRDCHDDVIRKYSQERYEDQIKNDYYEVLKLKQQIAKDIRRRMNA